MDRRPIRQSSHDAVMGRDDFDAWFKEKQRHDPGLRGAIEDAECRSNLLTRMIDRRLKACLTQDEVARSMGTTQSAVSELEGGGTDPRLSTLQRYARAVGCQVSVHVDASGIATGFHGWRQVPAPVVGAESSSLPAAPAGSVFVARALMAGPDAYSAA